MLALVPALLFLAIGPRADSPGPTPTAQDPAAVSAPLVRAELLVAKVKVIDGVATTKLTLSLSNDSRMPAEATWLLPLSEGSVADQFRMTMGGKLVAGEVLDAQRAQGVYESIVRQRRDPGLLEFFGQGCLRARVFPIPAQGKLDVEITYRELLPQFDGLQRWSFPLASGIEGRAPEQVVLDLEIESAQGLQHVFSHTDGVLVTRSGSNTARAVFEGRGEALRGRDLTVLYSPLEREFGLNVLSTKSGEAGTFKSG